MRSVRLADGTAVPAIGQGTWKMGERGADRRAEADALRLGLDIGLTLIDTAEMYADGGAEEVVADAIAGRRASVFLVSKVYPQNATRRGALAACDRSLKRLRTDYLDLYLLHWRGGTEVAETVEAFESLVASGKILRWGVSNFDTEDMAEVTALPEGGRCATNQVLYNPDARGIEFDLLPWCAERRMPVMAYSPVGQGGRLLRHPTLKAIAARLGATTAQVALAWAIRHPHVLAIPKAATAPHVHENAAASSIVLDDTDLADIDAAWPPPRQRRPLAML